MVESKKIGCMLFSVGKEFKELAQCAISSFKKFHPDVTLHVIDESNIESYGSSGQYEKEIRDHCGIFRFVVACEIMEKHNYDKFILLGADTVTCSRMDEFLDDNENDILLTSCYAYQLSLPFGVGDNFRVLNTPLLCVVVTDEGRVVGEHFAFGSIYKFGALQEEFKKQLNLNLVMVDHLYANPDVLCVNSLEALKDVRKYILKHWEDYHTEENSTFLKGKGFDFLADQGGLNLLANLCIAQENSEISSGLDPSFLEVPSDVSMLSETLDLPSHKVKYIDVPYQTASACYNVRGKKSIEESNLPIGKLLTITPQNKMVVHPKAHPKCGDEDGLSISNYYVENNKLFTVDGKQVKVWHYLAHFGLYTEGQDHGRVNKIIDIDFEKLSDDEVDRGKKQFCDMVNSYVHDGIFNEETKKFFTEQCACGDFYQKKFTLE